MQFSADEEKKAPYGAGVLGQPLLNKDAAFTDANGTRSGCAACCPGGCTTIDAAGRPGAGAPAPQEQPTWSSTSAWPRCRTATRRSSTACSSTTWRSSRPSSTRPTVGEACQRVQPHPAPAARPVDHPRRHRPHPGRAPQHRPAGRPADRGHRQRAHPRPRRPGRGRHGHPGRQARALHRGRGHRTRARPCPSRSTSAPTTRTCSTIRSTSATPSRACAARPTTPSSRPSSARCARSSRTPSCSGRTSSSTTRSACSIATGTGSPSFNDDIQGTAAVVRRRHPRRAAAARRAALGPAAGLPRGGRGRDRDRPAGRSRAWSARARAAAEIRRRHRRCSTRSGPPLRRPRPPRRGQAAVRAAGRPRWPATASGRGRATTSRRSSRQRGAHAS